MFEIKYKFDDSMFKEFLIAMKDFGRDSVAVGVLGGDALQKHPDADITVGEIAAINEFGTGDGHVPPRPFLRDTFIGKPRLALNALAAATRSVIQGRASTQQALNRAGEIMADAVRATLLNGVPPPNKPATVDWKGHADTLIGLTGALYDAITHKILPGGK